MPLKSILKQNNILQVTIHTSWNHLDENRVFSRKIFFNNVLSLIFRSSLVPKPKGYPRKLLGHTNSHPPIKYTPETEIECKQFYRVYISCKRTYSALSGHPVHPLVFPLRDRTPEAALLWFMDMAFWGPKYLLRGSLFSDKTVFSELLADQSLVSWPSAFTCGCLSLLFWQREEKIFGLWELDNSMPCVTNKSAWSWVQIFCTCFAQEWILHKVPGKWSIANVKTPWSGSQLPCSCVSIYSTESKVPLNQNRNSFYSLWMHKSGHIVLLELQAICTHLSPSTCFAQQVACNYLIIKIIGIFTLLVLCRSRRLPSNFYTSWECKPDVLVDFQVGRLHRLSKSSWYF